MKKAELIKVLMERVGEEFSQPVVRKAIPRIVDELFAMIREELSKREDIKIPNFGHLKLKKLKKKEREQKRKLSGLFFIKQNKKINRS